MAAGLSRRAHSWSCQLPEPASGRRSGNSISCASISSGSHLPPRTTGTCSDSLQRPMSGGSAVPATSTCTARSAPLPRRRSSAASLSASGARPSGDASSATASPSASTANPPLPVHTTVQASAAAGTSALSTIARSGASPFVASSLHTSASHWRSSTATSRSASTSSASSSTTQCTSSGAEAIASSIANGASRPSFAAGPRGSAARTKATRATGSTRSTSSAPGTSSTGETPSSTRAPARSVQRTGGGFSGSGKRSETWSWRKLRGDRFAIKSLLDRDLYHREERRQAPLLALEECAVAGDHAAESHHGLGAEELAAHVDLRVDRRRGRALRQRAQEFLAARERLSAALVEDARGVGGRQARDDRLQHLRGCGVHVDRGRHRQRGDERGELCDDRGVESLDARELAQLEHRAVRRAVGRVEPKIVRVLRAVRRHDLAVGIDPIDDRLRE